MNRDDLIGKAPPNPPTGPGRRWRTGRDEHPGQRQQGVTRRESRAGGERPFLLFSPLDCHQSIFSSPTATSSGVKTRGGGCLPPLPSVPALVFPPISLASARGGRSGGSIARASCSSARRPRAARPRLKPLEAAGVAALLLLRRRAPEHRRQLQPERRVADASVHGGQLRRRGEPEGPRRVGGRRGRRRERRPAPLVVRVGRAVRPRRETTRLTRRDDELHLQRPRVRHRAHVRAVRRRALPLRPPQRQRGRRQDLRRGDDGEDAAGDRLHLRLAFGFASVVAPGVGGFLQRPPSGRACSEHAVRSLPVPPPDARRRSPPSAGCSVLLRPETASQWRRMEAARRRRDRSKSSPPPPRKTRRLRWFLRGHARDDERTRLREDEEGSSVSRAEASVEMTLVGRRRGPGRRRRRDSFGKKSGEEDDENDGRDPRSLAVHALEGVGRGGGGAGTVGEDDMEDGPWNRTRNRRRVRRAPTPGARSLLPRESVVLLPASRAPLNSAAAPGWDKHTVTAMSHTQA